MSDESVSSVMGNTDNLLSVPLQERSIDSPHIDVFLSNSSQYDNDMMKKRKWDDSLDGPLIGDKYNSNIKSEYDSKRLRNELKDEMSLNHLNNSFNAQLQAENAQHSGVNDNMLPQFPNLLNIPPNNNLNNPLTVPLISNVSTIIPTFTNSAPGSGTPTMTAHASGHLPIFMMNSMAHGMIMNGTVGNLQHNINSSNSNVIRNAGNQLPSHGNNTVANNNVNSNNNNNNNNSNGNANNVLHHHLQQNLQMHHIQQQQQQQQQHTSLKTNGASLNTQINVSGNDTRLFHSNSSGSNSSNNNMKEDDDDDDDMSLHPMLNPIGGMYPSGDEHGDEQDDGKKGKGKRGRKKLISTTKNHTREGKWSNGEKQQLEEVVRRVLIEAGYQSYEEGLRILLDRKGKLPDNQKGAWRKIYDCMHDRKEKSVYHCAYRLLTAKMSNPTHNHKWTSEEEDKLKALVDQFGKCWSKCGFALNRPPWACRDKWRLIKEDYSQGTWLPEEDNKLLLLVKPHLSEDGVAKNIDWTYISQQIGTRSHISCRRRWVSVHAMLTQNAEDTSRARFNRIDDATIIDWIYRSNYVDISDIKFNEIPSVYLPPMICTRFTAICRKEIPNYRNLAFVDVMDHLKNVYSDVSREEIEVNVHNAKVKRYEAERMLLKRVENLQQMQMGNGGQMLALGNIPGIDDSASSSTSSSVMDLSSENAFNYLQPMNLSLNGQLQQPGPIQGPISNPPPIQGSLNMMPPPITTSMPHSMTAPMSTNMVPLNQAAFFGQPLNYLNMMPMPLPQVPIMMHHDINMASDNDDDVSIQPEINK